MMEIMLQDVEIVAGNQAVLYHTFTRGIEMPIEEPVCLVPVHWYVIALLLAHWHRKIATDAKPFR